MNSGFTYNIMTAYYVFLFFIYGFTILIIVSHKTALKSYISHLALIFFNLFGV